jgi:hypothetical protein
MTMAKKKIPLPDFKSAQEEREFWDTHSFDEIEGVEEIEVERSPNPKITFAIRLDPETVRLIRDVAQAKGERPTQMVREWLIERAKLERDVARFTKPGSAGAIQAAIQRAAAEASRATSEAAYVAVHDLVGSISGEESVEAHRIAQGRETASDESAKH